MFDFIHESFTGGSTEVYKPYGKDIKCYDVNSLYPTAMKYNMFPVGEITQFQGNIDWLYKLDPEFLKRQTYWIGDASVSTFKDLDKPYIQVNHLDKSNGLIGKRTIAPDGSWNMKINSIEYYNALKDYNIKINSGFEARDIFSEYISKIKGFPKDVAFDTMKSLLVKDSTVDLNHVKWFRNVSESQITLRDQLYKLSASGSKRDFIYNSDNLAIGTKFKIVDSHKFSPKEDESKGSNYEFYIKI